MEGGDTMEFLTVAVPAAIGVSIVVATVALIFWYGAGRQSSYEDAVKARQGHAEREMRKMAEKEKEQKQKREKKRVGKNKKQDVAQFSGQEEAEANPPTTQKSILKSSRPNSVTKDKTDTPSTSRVDFEFTDTPVKSNKGPRTNPPTPHPSAQRTSIPPLARALMDDEMSDEGEIEDEVPKIKSKKTGREEQQPKIKPKAMMSPPVTDDVQPTKTATTSGSSTRSSGPKKTKKPKPTINQGTLDALPASRISDIVGSSSLSDEEIQHLIDQLLEMMDANAEWKGASKGTDSIKTLKKTNEDLQSRCKEAEKTVHAHFSKIKDLRAEIKGEQARRQSSEAQLQSKISKQTSETTIFKTKITGLEDELKQTKQLSSSQALKTLEEENGTLTLQMSAIVQKNSNLTGQLAAANKSHQEAQEQLTRLHTELRRAKSAAKTPTGGEGRGQLERVTELEGRLHHAEEDNLSLQTALTSTEGEKDRLMEQLQTLTTITRERDTLTQQLSATQQQLQETQVSIQALEQKGSEGVQLHDKIHQLREHNTELMAQVASLEKKSSDVSLRAEELRVVNSQLESQVDTLQKESMVGAAAVAEEIQQLRAHNTQLGSQVEALQKQSAESVVVVEALQQQQTVGPTMEQVEEINTQLKAAHEDEQRALLAECDAKRTSEVMGLNVQYEAELQSVKEELSRVRREGEEGKSSVEQQLASEKDKKQELQSELESLKAATLSAQQNGPIDDQVDSHHEELLRAKEEEIVRVMEEKEDLKARVKQDELKLTDLQGKNNSLRDNCWKARDDTAKMQKECEAKLKQVYKETESRVKAAELRVTEEMEERERALLQRLFPDITVEDTTSFAAWVDKFETEAQFTLEETKKQLCTLTERVAELEQTEHDYIEETQRFRETLNNALGNLTSLQTQVTGESIQNMHLLEERDEMLQKERMTNRDLQQQLSKEKETTASLEEEIKKVGVGGEERVRQLEGELLETSNTKTTLTQEIHRLTGSLDQMTEQKAKADDTIGQERMTNRDLQQQLSKEKETTASLEEEIKKVGVGGEERVRQLEGELLETSNTKTTLTQEIHRLTGSLDQMTEQKAKADDTIGQLELDLAKKFQESEESFQSTVELGKIGQSIAIPSDSTEV